MDRRSFLGSVGSVATVQSDLDALARKWDAIRSRITSEKALTERNAFVRARIRSLLHVPSHRPPVNAQVTGALQRDGYRIEKLRGDYNESWTVFWITAHFLTGAARFVELGVPLQ